jgi:thiol-disulfide isomerase/thioredoxin
VFLRAIAMVLMFASVPAPSTSQVAPTHSPPKGFEQLQSNFPAPKTSFSDENLAGKTIDAFKGKIVVLNFWATWCTPCIAEMPALERLADRLPLAKFSVIAISQDRGGGVRGQTFLGSDWCA